MIDFIVPIKIDSDIRYKLLEQCFTSLHENTDPNSINRIIVVDDRSDLFTDQDYLKSFSEIARLDNVVVERNLVQRGVGGSKNRGIEIAKRLGQAPFVYIFDADTYFTKGWDISLMQSYLNYGNEFKIIGGGIHPFLQPRRDEGNHEITSHDAVSGWSWLLTYDVLDKYGKFEDNSLGTGKSEDWAFCQKIRNDGYKVGCIQPQTIAHCGLTNTEGNHIVGYDESLNLARRVAPEAILL